MPAFVAKRVLLALPILFGVSVVVFLTIKLIPGDPVSALLGPSATPSARAALESRLGLDDPLPVQYLHWATHAIQGDLGSSISLQQPAGSLVMTAFGNTLLLLAAALVIATVGGVVLGVVMALRPRGVVGRVISATSLGAISIPQYTVALLLLLLAVQTGAFPVGGMHDTGQGGTGDLLAHLALPAIAAALTPMGIVARMFSVALAEVLQQEFVANMRARGLGSRAILRHAMHNALPSLLTITGLQVGYLLGGVLFVETIFTWPGLGQLVYGAISSRDMALIQAGVLVSAVVLVLVNVLVDTAHAAVDPRVRG
ncbi:ABC transporter permease [Patulibacter sp. NPDC049589]|uniref:ABC transporter permease n=1 Tax=Patulibacter sp. NPDC049589 TaxID=3154731 RepID=UPI003426EBE7